MQSKYKPLKADIMKTNIEMKEKDSKYGDWQKGEKGYIIGFSHDSDGKPFLAVAIQDRVILCATYEVRVLND